ncbi:MAG: alpha/beta fold hydrolase BchO [Pseudomonadota bacterium]
MTPPPPPDWPFADASRIVEAVHHRWHVQSLGDGPDLLLLHGAGGATHSWRGLAPRLAETHRVTMIDLPGHGFTRPGSARWRLPQMAADVTALMRQLDITPTHVIGHSAGAAIALQMARDDPRPVISLNGAFQMFEGVAGWLFPMMAKALALNPLTVPLFTAAGSAARTRRLIDGTGSRIDAEGLAQYHRLISDREHVSGALSMMANWSLNDLVRAAPGIGVPVLLLAGERDRAVPPRISHDMAKRLPDARLHVMPDVGHLMHEEAPAEVARAVLDFVAVEAV